MQMRYILTIISILLLTTTLFGQKPKKSGSNSSWRDTTYILVKLDDTIKDRKIVAVDIGKKATIFVHLRPMLIEARENLSNDFVKEDYNKIIHYFDSASSRSDTIFMGEYYNLQHFEYLVSHQLSDGNAKVFYKKQKTFVDTISHRLERYGGNADRFFYLPDKRPFFAVQEFSGILDNNEDFFGKGHYDTYVKEGEKLQSLQKE
jgi:hypothetical protein